MVLEAGQLFLLRGQIQIGPHEGAAPPWHPQEPEQYIKNAQQAGAHFIPLAVGSKHRVVQLLEETFNGHLKD